MSRIESGWVGFIWVAVVVLVRRSSMLTRWWQRACSTVGRRHSSVGGAMATSGTTTHARIHTHKQKRDKRQKTKEKTKQNISPTEIQETRTEHTS